MVFKKRGYLNSLKVFCSFLNYFNWSRISVVYIEGDQRGLRHRASLDEWWLKASRSLFNELAWGSVLKGWKKWVTFPSLLPTFSFFLFCLFLLSTGSPNIWGGGGGFSFWIFQPILISVFSEFITFIGYSIHFTFHLMT